MPKIRGIKPEFWTDEDIVELSIPARLLFIGLWNLACDNGHVPDKPKQIKMRILPGDDIDVDALLDELVSNGRITRGAGTVTIRKFAQHQKPHRKWWTCCELPGCSIPEGAPTQGFNRPKADTKSGSQPLRNRGTTVDHGGTTDEVELSCIEVDVDSELKGAASKPKRATQLPAAWRPNSQHEDFATTNLLALDDELARFADYHRAKGSTYKDWDAAFRNWLRKAVDYAQRNKPTRTTTNLRAVNDIPTPPDGLTDAEYRVWWDQNMGGA